MYTLSDKKLIMLRPKDIKPSPARPRRDFDEYELKLYRTAGGKTFAKWRL